MEKKELTNTQYAENRKAIGIGFKAGLAPMLLFFVYLIITSLDNTNFSSAYLDLIGAAIIIPIFLLWPGILLGIAGAFVGKHWKRTKRAIWFGALLGALPISAIIVYVFLNFCIGWC